MSLQREPGTTCRIVCVGDVHDDWGDADESAAEALEPDVILFVGDYGNENIEVVRRISSFATKTNARVAAVFGNHDGFYSMSERGRANCPYDGRTIDRVADQLKLFEDLNPSYKAIELERPLPLSVVGGRPFSWGGPHWKYAPFYRKYFKVSGMKQSAELITSAATNAKTDSVVFVSHSGPTGLGSLPSSPCGRDWGSTPGGDFGDPDLRTAIDALRKSGKFTPLVVFGHMHHRLNDGKGLRKMLAVEDDAESGRTTVFLDAAVVPRRRPSSRSSEAAGQFSVVDLNNSAEVLSVTQVWCTALGRVVDRNVLYELRSKAAQPSG